MTSLYVKRLTTLQQALARLHEALILLHKELQSPFYTSFRDSAIQRFEFCTELFWKTLKEHLSFKHGIIFEVVSPRSVVRAAHAQKIITDTELYLCSAMIEDRNLTSHTYHEELAQKIVKKIIDYYALMNAVTQKMATDSYI